MTAPLALALLVWLQAFPTSSLDEALQALQAGEPLPASLPRPLGRAAAARIAPGQPLEELERLTSIARAGRAEDRLAAALLEVVAKGDDEVAPYAVTTLGDLPVGVLPRQAPEAALQRLVGLLEAEDVPEVLASHAAGFVGRWATPPLVATALGAWHERPDRALRLIRSLGANRSAPGADWVRMVSELPSDGEAPMWGEALGPFVRDLALRDVAAFDAALALVAGDQPGPGAALVRGVGGAPLDDAERLSAAEAALGTYLGQLEFDIEGLEASTLAAVVHAAGELLMVELSAYLPSLALHGRARSVRLAAIEALTRVGYRDAPTVDLLLPLLEDPDGAVAAAAYHALGKKTGQELPARRAVWDRWRASVELPEAAPEGWLASQRAIEADLRRVAREREARRQQR